MEQFYFDGFEPTEALRQKAARLLAHVREAALCNGHVNASLDYDGELYQCEIEISSLALPFAVSMASRSPELSLDRAEFAILRKLDQWRRARLESTNETSVAG